MLPSVRPVDAARGCWPVWECAGRIQISYACSRAQGLVPGFPAPFRRRLCHTLLDRLSVVQGTMVALAAMPLLPPKLCNPSVDAPTDASDKFGYLHGVGCCLLSGLSMQRVAAGQYGSARDGSRSHTRALGHRGWFLVFRPRFADGCAIPS